MSLDKAIRSGKEQAEKKLQELRGGECHNN